MSDDRWPGWQDEVRKAERERDWAPLGTLAVVILIAWLAGFDYENPDPAAIIMAGFGVALLRAILDVKAILIRHHWAVLRSVDRGMAGPSQDD